MKIPLKVIDSVLAVAFHFVIDVDAEAIASAKVLEAISDEIARRVRLEGITRWIELPIPRGTDGVVTIDADTGVVIRGAKNHKVMIGDKERTVVTFDFLILGRKNVGASPVKIV